MSVGLSVCLSVCLYAKISAISKPTGTPFGTKLLFGPGKVLNNIWENPKNVETLHEIHNF